ncbi:hypothetical protein C8Q74DRAFT_1373475 [Fomes fomentarius]|nr:hypothetical protein C8Q74DRAFT_1373475 [Fomes fomentarius]
MPTVSQVLALFVKVIKKMTKRRCVQKAAISATPRANSGNLIARTEADGAKAADPSRRRWWRRRRTMQHTSLYDRDDIRMEAQQAQTGNVQDFSMPGEIPVYAVTLAGAKSTK